MYLLECNCSGLGILVGLTTAVFFATYMFIVLDSASLNLIALAASCLCLVGLIKLHAMTGQVPEAEES